MKVVTRLRIGILPRKSALIADVSRVTLIPVTGAQNNKAGNKAAIVRIRKVIFA